MTPDRDYLGEKFRLLERAREDVYFRKLDQELIAKMRQQATSAPADTPTVTEPPALDFSPILVPVDFSPYAMRALEKAATLADHFDASIIALHVVSSEVGVQTLAARLEKAAVTPAETTVNDKHHDGATPDDDEVHTVLDHHREQAYHALEAFIPPPLAQHKVELRVVFGRPFERIVETAIKEEVALIVMGTHGRTGLAHIALGSIAERVVRLAPCSVMTVKAQTPESESWLKEFYATFLGIGA